jgi:hypothetical protein
MDLGLDWYVQKILAVWGEGWIETYIIGGLLILVTLLVDLSLLLVRTALSVAQSLPALTKELANLAYNTRISMSTKYSSERDQVVISDIPKEMPGFSSRTFSR